MGALIQSEPQQGILVSFQNIQGSIHVQLFPYSKMFLRELHPMIKLCNSLWITAFNCSNPFLQQFRGNIRHIDQSDWFDSYGLYLKIPPADMILPIRSGNGFME